MLSLNGDATGLSGIVVSDSSGNGLDVIVGDCFSVVSGCTDSNACNYNADAEEDDGSCAYEEDCAGECGGDAVEDNCGECDNNPFNDCIQDCYGD